jgi:hypothetical protein
MFSFGFIFVAGEIDDTLRLRPQPRVSEMVAS